MGVERQALSCCRRLRCRQGNGQQRIGAQLRLIRRAIKLKHALIQAPLIQGAMPQERRGEDIIDGPHGLEHALTQVAPRVLIAKLQGLPGPGGGAGGRGGPAKAAVAQRDVRFHRRIAPGIHDFPRDNVLNLCHPVPLSVLNTVDD